MYLITAYEQAEKDIGRKADKNRKIYNGMMKTIIISFWDRSLRREETFRRNEKFTADQGSTTE